MRGSMLPLLPFLLQLRTLYRLLAASGQGVVASAAVYRLVDRIADRVGSGHLIERLDLDHRGCGGPNCGCEIASSNLLSPEDSLQIIFSLGGGAPRFQHVWQSCQTMCSSALRLLVALLVHSTDSLARHPPVPSNLIAESRLAALGR